MRPTKNSGVIQIYLGFDGTQGNVQVYTTKFGRPSGNCRINGSDAIVKATRETLLCSTWFVDATGVGDSSAATLAYQPDGVVLLPKISGDTPARTLESIMKGPKKKLGSHGLKAMSKYLEGSGLETDSAVDVLLKKTFGFQEDEKAEKGRKDVGRGRGKKEAP